MHVWWGFEVLSGNGGTEENNKNLSNDSRSLGQHLTVRSSETSLRIYLTKSSVFRAQEHFSLTFLLWKRVQFFWGVTPYNLVEAHRRTGGRHWRWKLYVCLKRPWVPTRRHWVPSHKTVIIRKPESVLFRAIARHSPFLSSMCWCKAVGILLPCLG
jgi:hypothetical protein